MKVISGLAIVLFATPGPVEAQDRQQQQAPIEVIRHAAAIDCLLPADFYLHREGVRAPPYVSLGGWEAEIIHGERVGFAYWCVRDHSDEEYGPFSLVIRREHGEGYFNGCAEELSELDYAGGLYFVADYDLSGREVLRHLDRKSITFPHGTRRDAIISMWDGTGHAYVCDEGDWHVLPFH